MTGKEGDIFMDLSCCSGVAAKVSKSKFVGLIQTNA
eukprot:CAMPEP_0170469192 /NCGR_PEP_ID=MMETSP0123-20130129/12107_1 /TAXON_ID=182087 /ORGANISM="Favella ehrenbergii, Strain Fehren 1" /LENGTH=35 /DNA_ID= /DNA_START= /DNA_END= /DNA_ORIENTATION=